LDITAFCIINRHIAVYQQIGGQETEKEIEERKEFTIFSRFTPGRTLVLIE
jgi:hypothetical protein